MIFQGTVLGPILWNIFYADCSKPVRAKGFTETIFADDLNCFRAYAKSIGDAYIIQQLKNCQREVHVWGKANGVQFDAAKEHFHILGKTLTYGDNFVFLGTLFDPQLSMFKGVSRIASEAGRRLKMVLRVQRFYSTKHIFNLYKAHVLPYLERSIPAISHCSPSILSMLDNVQNLFLETAQCSSKDALLEYNLFPLSSRRSISMLGLLHHTQIGTAPNNLNKLFPKARSTLYHFSVPSCNPSHDKQIQSCIGPRSSITLRRSIFGLIPIYNKLPAHVISAETAKLFQNRLQSMLKLRAKEGVQNWPSTFDVVT